MGYDEKIMGAFKKASVNGLNEVSVRDITLLTGIPQRVVRNRIDSMKKYGEVEEGAKQKIESRYFRANKQLL